MTGPRLAAAAFGVAAVTFGFRVLLTTGFTNDHYMHLAWASQVLAGDVPGRDFVDPGMLATYSLSALAQWISPTPFSELVLTAGMIAIATGLTFIVTARLTGSIAASLVAAGSAMVLRPHFYSYPKVLAPVVTLLVVIHYLSAPSTKRLVLLAVWTVTAGLLRYDLGLYSAASIVVALAVAHYWTPHLLVRSLGQYVAFVAIVALPYLAFVQWSEGLSRHLAEAMEFARSDAHQLAFAAPVSPVLSGEAALSDWGSTDAATILYYLARAILPLALLVLVWRGRNRLQTRFAAAAAAIVLLGCYVAFILRHPIPTRLLDLATIGSIVGVWTATEFIRLVLRPGEAEPVRSAWIRRALTAPVVAVMLLAGLSVWTLARVGENLAETRVLDGWEKMRERFVAVHYQGTQWPWSAWWPAGNYPDVVRYINECTAPTDRLFLTWPAAEYFYFSQRPFAGGHSLLLAPRSFTSAADQQLIIERLRNHRVPIVLINDTRRQEIREAYAPVDRYLATHYRPVDHFSIYDGSKIVIAVRSDLMASTTYGEHAWPCRFTSTDGGS